jgi:hypothetical protein
MSVALTNELSGRLKRSLGRLSYAVAGARAFARHPTFRARLTRPGAAEVMDEAVVHQVVVANGRFYGGGVLVARASTLDDGLLTAYALGTRSRWQLAADRRPAAVPGAPGPPRRFVPPGPGAARRDLAAAAGEPRRRDPDADPGRIRRRARGACAC